MCGSIKEDELLRQPGDGDGRVFAQHVGIDLRGLNRAVAELFLDEPDVVLRGAIEERGVGMPARVDRETGGEADRFGVGLEDPKHGSACERTISAARGREERGATGGRFFNAFLPCEEGFEVFAERLPDTDASLLVPFPVPDDQGSVLTIQDQIANLEIADFRNPEAGVEGDMENHPIAHGLFPFIGHRSRRALSAMFFESSNLVVGEEILVSDLERHLTPSLLAGKEPNGRKAETGGHPSQQKSTFVATAR